MYFFFQLNAHIIIVLDFEYGILGIIFIKIQKIKNENFLLFSSNHVPFYYYIPLNISFWFYFIIN